MSIQIKSKYPAKCSACRTQIGQGERCWYLKGARHGHAVRCLGCGMHPSDTPMKSMKSKGPGQTSPNPTRSRSRRRQPDLTPEGAATLNGDPNRYHDHGTAVIAGGKTAVGVVPNKKYRVVHFPTVHDMIHSAKSGKCLDKGNANALGEDRDEMRRGTSWRNGLTFQKLEDRMSAPEEPPHSLSELRAEIDTELGLHGVRRKRHRDQQFGDLDLRRKMSGSLTPFSRMKKTKVPKAVVSIFINMSVTNGRQNHELMWRGAAALALTDVYEAAGYSVELVIGRTSAGFTTDGRGIIAKATLKEAGEPLDLSKLAAILTDIGVYRGIVMPACLAIADKKADWGQGKTVDLPRDEVAEQVEGFDVYLPPTILSKSAAVDFLREHVTKAQSAMQ